MNKKIAIIGTGAMGTAMGKVLSDRKKKYDIVFYGINESELNELKTGTNSNYFSSSIELPNFETTNSITKALDDADYILLALPSHVMHLVLGEVMGNISTEALIINVSKGFFPGTQKSLHNGIKDATAHSKLIRGVVSLIGPSHAEEVVKSAPTIVSAVDYDMELIKEVQNLFSNDYFRVYAQTDVAGAEVGAAYKNVLAIASGLTTGLGYGINTTAALLTRGLSEMQKFNQLQGGQAQTLMGLSGIGDLIVTAMSPLSRNWTFGNELATNKKEALKTTKTVEGIVALKIIHQIAKDNSLELPLVNFLHDIVFGDNEPSDFNKQLWSRALTSE